MGDEVIGTRIERLSFERSNLDHYRKWQLLIAFFKTHAVGVSFLVFLEVPLSLSSRFSADYVVLS
jgi:hypothetical protein